MLDDYESPQISPTTISFALSFVARPHESDLMVRANHPLPLLLGFSCFVCVIKAQSRRSGPEGAAKRRDKLLLPNVDFAAKSPIQ